MPLPIAERTVNEIYEATVSAFAADMATNFPNLVLTYDNINFDPENAFATETRDDAFARFNMQHVVGDAGNAGIGNNYFRRNGIITVQVFTRANTGRVRSNAIVDGVLLFFEKTSVPGIWFRGQSPSEAGNDGSWYQVNVSSEFIYDTLRT